MMNFIRIMIVVVVGIAILMDKYEFPKRKNFFRFTSSLKYEKNIETNVSIMFSMFYILFVIGCVLWYWFYLLNNKFNSYMVKFVEQINGVEGIIVAYASIVMAVIIFSANMEYKEYCLILTPKDIMKLYKIYHSYYCIVGSLVVSICCTFCLQKFEGKSDIDGVVLGIYEIAVLVMLGTGWYCFFIVGKLTIGNRKIGISSLNKIYNIFWNNAVVKSMHPSKYVVYTNLSYLLDRYNRVVKRKQYLKNISSIEYEDCAEKIDVLYKNACWTLCGLNVVIGVVQLLFYGYFDILRKQCLITVLVVMITVMLTAFPFFARFNRRYIVALVMNTRGYVFKRKNKIRFVGDVSLFPTFWYGKYVLCIKNIMALYYVILSCMDKEICKYTEDSLIDMIYELKRNDTSEGKVEKALYYMPVFTCGYLFYLNCDKSNRQKVLAPIRALYKSLDLKEEKKDVCELALKSFLYDVSRYRTLECNKSILQYELQEPIMFDSYNEYEGYWEMLNEKERSSDKCYYKWESNFH